MDLVLPALEGGEAEIGGAGQHARAGRPGQQIELLVAGAPAQQAKAQRAGDDPLEQLACRHARAAGTALRPAPFDRSARRRSHRPAMVWLACASARCSFDRMLSEPNTTSMSSSRSAKPQQHLDAARKGDRLERGVAGEQIFPAGFLAADQLGTEHGQRLGGRFQLGVGEEIVWDGLPPFPHCSNAR